MNEFPESSLIFRQRILFAESGSGAKIEKESEEKKDEFGDLITYIPHPKITIFDYFLFLLNQAVGTV
jgi:hypothetical protein